MRPADLTLTAGPNDVSARVKAALGAPILYHYDPVVHRAVPGDRGRHRAHLRDDQPRDHPDAG